MVSRVTRANASISMQTLPTQTELQGRCTTLNGPRHLIDAEGASILHVSLQRMRIDVEHSALERDHEAS
jgi:hypothetical protein